MKNGSPINTGCTTGVPGWLRDEIAATGIAGAWVVQDNLDTAPRLKGAYLLAIRLDTPINIALPRIGACSLSPSWYLYAGSANGPGGMGARVCRHFRRDKPRHWHVDRLTTACSHIAALLMPDGHECTLVDTLLVSGRFVPAIAGFGSSDCRRCNSHLLVPQAKPVQAPI